MTTIDWILLVVLALSTLAGFWRGFVKEALSLLGWIASFYIAWQFSDDVMAYPSVFMSYLNAHVSMHAARAAIVFVLLFLATMVVFWIINYLVTKLVSLTPLAGLNRILGMCFGLLRGAVVVLVFIAVLQATPLAHQSAWQHSTFIPMVQHYSHSVIPRLDRGIQHLIMFSGSRGV